MSKTTWTTRRTFLKSLAAAGGIAAAPCLLPSSALERACAAAGVKIRLGSCMLGLEDAKRAGLEGAEVRVGNAADRLEIADPAVRAKYKEQMAATGLPISSLMMGLLNSYPLASDPRGPAWLEQSIDGAKDLGAKVILVAFFGKGNLLDENNQLKTADVDVVVERLKAAAPKAQAAGVILALENYLSARQNLEILDRIGHPAAQIYYDVGNATGKGYDVPAEIRLLNRRIAIFHFKDNPHYLGEGRIRFPEIATAIREIGYQGWIVLETTSPAKNPVADAARNAAFIRKLFDAGRH